ncbi:hypothetical protein [Streptomyces sp. NPDC001070]
MAVAGCQESTPQDAGLRIEPGVHAPVELENRLAASFADRPSRMTTVALTTEDPYRTASAMAVLADTGMPTRTLDAGGIAEWWTKSLSVHSEKDAALRVQHLRIGLRAFGERLDPGLVGKAASATVAGVLRGKPSLPDLETAVRLADEVGNADPANAAGSRRAGTSRKRSRGTSAHPTGHVMSPREGTSCPTTSHGGRWRDSGTHVPPPLLSPQRSGRRSTACRGRAPRRPCLTRSSWSNSPTRQQMAAQNQGEEVNTSRTWRRLLGGVLLLAAVITVIYGFGTAQSDGSIGTALVAVVLAAFGIHFVRSRAGD